MSASPIRVPQSLLSERIETSGKPIFHAHDSVVFRRADLAREVGNGEGPRS